MRVKHTQNICCGLMMLVIMLSAGLAAGAETINYAYDPMGRVTRTESDAAAVWVYAYDPMGNRVTTTTTGSPLEVGVIAAYPFSEGSGLKTADVSGHGYDGTMTGATWITDGKVGKALRFDGGDDAVSTSLHIDQRASSAGVTMMAWVRPQSSSAGIHQVISSDDGGYDWSLMRWGATWHVFTGAGYADTGLSVDVGVWQHVAAVFLPGTGVTFYKNGQDVTMSQIGYDTSDNPLSIGDNPGSWTEYFDGDIDEVRIYNTPLSAQDILTLYRSSGLVASYPFSEGSGTSIADASGNGNDGTLLNGTSWTPDGKVGHALSFDGIDDYVQIPHRDDLNVTDTFTLAAWVYTDLSQPGTLLSKDGVGSDPTGAYNIYLSKTAYEVPYIWYETNNVDGLYGHYGLTSNTWHHVVVTFDAAASPNMHIYVDSIERGSGDVTAPSALTYDLLIGRRGWDGDPRHFKGNIDEVRIYNIALSPEEVIDVYYSYMDPGGSPGLVASYPFSEGSGTTTADASGHGNDGTITGATWTTAGKVGNALNFDGDQDYVEIPHPGYLREGSIAAWVSLTSVPEVWFSVTLTGAPIDGQSDGLNLGVHPNYSDHLAFGIYSDQWNWADSGITPQPNTWYHLVGTWGAEGLTISVDGELKGTNPYIGGVPGYTQYAYIAANSWGQYLPGIADEVQIYNYALSDSEVQDLYTSSDSGLVASYPFSEGTGTTTADASGNGYDGDLYGTTWTSNGKTGNALSFDGVDDYVKIPSGPDISGLNALTIEAWVKSTRTTDTYPPRIIEIGNDYLDSTALVLDHSSSDGYLGTIRGWIQGQGARIGSVCTPLQGESGYYNYNDSQWHHVAITYDGSEIHLYVDGVVKDSTSGSGTIGSPAKTLIGAHNFSGPDGHYFQGTIDEVMVYERALTDQEIQDHAGSSTPNNLVASYPFSEGTGTTTTDASGNGHDGTLLNGVAWTTNGKVGNALSFDGVDDYVEIADEAAFDVENTDAFSIAAWINVEDVPYWQKVVSKLDNTGSPYPGYELIISDAGAIYVQLLNAWPNSVLAETTTATGFDDQQWHHLVATYDGSSSAAGLKIYVDGVEAATTVDHETLSGSILNDVSVKIGRRTNESLSGFVKGKIDEVTFYDRALSASEVQDLAGVGGSATFAATSFSASSASLSTRVDDLVEADGSSMSINVGASPDLNYGIGDFTVVVTARTADASSVYKETPPWPPSRGEYIPQISSREEFTGSVSHVAIGVRQGKDLLLYLDGALQAQKSVGDGRITRLNVNVGLDDVSTNADIEDVKLFPYALSPEEIAGLSAESELK